MERTDWDADENNAAELMENPKLSGSPDHITALCMGILTKRSTLIGRELQRIADAAFLVTHPPIVVEEHSTKAACETCRFGWKAREFDRFECRLRAPQCSALSPGADPNREWPYVRGSDWCGEYEAGITGEEEGADDRHGRRLP